MSGPGDHRGAGGPDRAPDGVLADPDQALGGALADSGDLDALQRRLGSIAGPARKPIGMRRIRIAADALDFLVADIAEIRGEGPVVVVMDTTPMTRAGTDLKAEVMRRIGAAMPVRPAVIGAPGVELHADEAALAEADVLIAGAGCVVSVGSGTITDIAKDAAMRAGMLPLVVVQTAVSVNAFSDDMAVLLRDGVKRTVPSRWPDVLEIDLAVLADTPPAMNLAGLGELCSMFTAPADWYLAAAAGMDDSYDPGVVALFREGAESILADGSRFARRDGAALHELAGRMTLTGIAMGVAGRTAPLSGTEHLVSHFIDMDAAARGRPLAFHGAQVGVAAVLAATIWRYALDVFDPADLVHADPDPVLVERQVRAAFDPLDPSGRMAEECWRDVRQKLDRWAALRPARPALAEAWAGHRDAIRALTAAPSDLAATLQGAGAPVRFSDLDPAPDPGVVRWAVRSLPLMRNRFTIVDLLFMTGAWDEPLADAMLDEAGEAGGGL